MDQLWTFRPFAIDHAFKVPNQVMMHRERLNAKHLFKFKCQRRNFFLHRAAAQIWARGIPWENAIAMVQNAFDATTQVEDDNP